MTESEWLSKAKKLHRTCLDEQVKGNGSRGITANEATMLNNLQHAIGSHHSRPDINYKQAKESLDEMFDHVKAGRATPPLVKG